MFDEDLPDWTEEDELWAIQASDFGTFEAMHAFLQQREALLTAAETAGVPRATFLPFEPGKPGFEDRARNALAALPKALGWATE